MRRGPSSQIASLALGVLMMSAAACSSDAAKPVPTFSPTPTSIPRVEDHVLKIGVLIPQGSANADIGESIRTAVDLAVKKINDDGGYGGSPVIQVPADEGVAGVGIDPAIATLIDSNVDAIIGPASSLNALAGLAEIVNAGVVSCSPTASASLLDGYPDHNLFFRTIPSDSLQALAIAEGVDRTGFNRATVAYIDDAYGQAFVDSVSVALRQKGIDQSEPVPFSADNQSIDAAATKIASIAAGVVVVIGDATSGPVMLAAIDRKEPAMPPVYVINDAMRRRTATAEPMGESLANRITGVSPVAYSIDPQFLAEVGATPDNPSPYAANAFDCVNLIALAALQAGSTQPTSIAAMIPGVSDSGSPCTSFAECKSDMQSGNNINYDGPGGTLTVDNKGDLSSAIFQFFGFDAAGKDFIKGSVRVPPI
jgi:branched-chain amino acid transport system substrate-binding protein